MTAEKIIGTNEELQRSAELARRNIERLKTQPPLPPLRKPPAHRGKRGGRRQLDPKTQATLVHRLGGAALFIKSRLD